MAAGRVAWASYRYGNHAYCAGPFTVDLASPESTDLGVDAGRMLLVHGNTLFITLASTFGVARLSAAMPLPVTCSAPCDIERSPRERRIRAPRR